MSLSPRLGTTDQPSVRLTAQQQRARERVRRRLADGTYRCEAVPCVCGTDGGLEVARRDRFGLPIVTVICPTCGLLRTSPRLTQRSNTLFYREDYSALYRSGSAEQQFNRAVSRGRVYLNLLQAHRGPIQTVYEMGCGTGGVLAPFAKAGYAVGGCDYCGRSIATGQRRGLPLIEGELSDLVQERGVKADLIIMAHVFEHLLDLNAGLAEVANALNPDGLVFIEVPGIIHIERTFGGDLLRYLQNAHTYHFSANTLGYVLKRSQLEVVYVNDACFAVVRNRRCPSADNRAPAPPLDEARSVLRWLARAEQALLRQRQPSGIK